MRPWQISPYLNSWGEQDMTIRGSSIIPYGVSLAEIRAMPPRDFRAAVRSEPRFTERYSSMERHIAKEDRMAARNNPMLPRSDRGLSYIPTDDDKEWTALFFRGGMTGADFLRGFTDHAQGDMVLYIAIRGSRLINVKLINHAVPL